MFLWLLTPYPPGGADKVGGADEGEPEAGKSCYRSVTVREYGEDGETGDGVDTTEENRGETDTENGRSNFRERLSAFAQSSSALPKVVAPSPSSSPRTERRKVLTGNQSEDTQQTFHIVTETIGYILWHSAEFGREVPPWRVWGSVFHSVDVFSSSHILLYPASVIKQRSHSVVCSTSCLICCHSLNTGFSLC